MRWFRSAALLPLVAFSSAPVSETIQPSDNRVAAGTLRGGVLTVALEARTGSWFPEGEKGRALEVAAFAEEGKPLTTPGPLLRVPAGTAIRASLRNSLDRPLTVFGFGAARGLADSTVIPAGERRELSFRAAAPGTYYYLARRSVEPPFGARASEDAQLNGVIIVDPVGAVPNPAERTMAISWWCPADPRSPSGMSRCTMTINGQSWPHTERLEYAQGDSVHWRVVNFTELDHPMHLHGFYFRVDGKGDGVRDSLYTAAERRMAVTEVLAPFQTMEMAWRAERPGNWVFHCHYATHLSHLVSLDTENGTHDASAEHQHPSDRPHQMFGLVMGVSIAPRGAEAAAPEPARALRLIQREKPGVYGAQPGMSFVLDGTPEAASPDALPVPGPTLVLTRNQRVAVTVVNQSSQSAAVHWHGIELESYPDGVPGWSGMGSNILPAIKPHDSLTVRWTPPRAGSFMYHTHFNEALQMGSGLYGPIIVTEPGERFDPETDRILFFGTAGTPTNPVFGPFPGFVLNGATQPGPMQLKAGTRYRFRLFNLAGDTPLMVQLKEGEAPVSWRAVAKDGYPLPASQATSRPAVLVFDPGEIYDFEFTPGKTGTLALSFGLPPFPGPPPPPPPPGTPPPPPLPPTVTVVVNVR